MLRQLVASSLQDYLDFFKQHAALQPLDPQQEVALWSCMPVFETELVTHDGAPCCRAESSLLWQVAAGVSWCQPCRS
jgi:hypothetical protein